MPLNWSQVKAGLDPNALHLRTAADYAGKATEWQDYCDAERPLEDAIQKFVQDDRSMGTRRRRSRVTSAHRRHALESFACDDLTSLHEKTRECVDGPVRCMDCDAGARGHRPTT